jgi:protein gp37
MGNPRYRNGFDLTLHHDQLGLPLRWKQPRRIFVNSMSDLFHDDVPRTFIQQTFDVMTRAHWHTFQVLTKRAERLRDLAPSLSWAPHIWQGVSVESNRYLARIDCLRDVPATVRFLSLEPLLGPLADLDLRGIHWVIVGGESGPGHRDIRAEWVRDIQDQCLRAKVAFFFKQWGGRTSTAGGRELAGQTWSEYPVLT